MSHTPVIQKLKAHTRRGQALARVAAAGWSARRATSDADRVRASRVLADVLGEARGLPMKFGQAFADPSDQGAFTTLTTSVEPLPLATVEPVIAEALAAAPSRIFEDLDPVGIAASLGQVHRARLRDGGEVAVKVQYPNIAVAMQTELGVLGWLPGFGPARRWGVDLDGYRTMLTSALEEELDYRGEAARQYGILFAWLCKRAGLDTLGTVVELGRHIEMTGDDGHRWGSLELWLKTPSDRRPALPISLPALLAESDESATARVTSLVRDGELQQRVQDIVRQGGRRAEVHLQTVDERWGPPVRVHKSYSHNELVVLVLNTRHPLTKVALSRSGREREMVLLEIARRTVDWSSGGPEPLDLLELQQVLLAQRLRL